MQVALPNGKVVDLGENPSEDQLSAFDARVTQDFPNAVPQTSPPTTTPGGTRPYGDALTPLGQTIAATGGRLTDAVQGIHDFTQNPSLAATPRLIGNVATAALPVLPGGPEAMGAGALAELAYRSLAGQPSEGGAHLAAAGGQLLPSMGGTVARRLATLPTTARKLATGAKEAYASAFSPRAVESYRTLSGGEMPRGAGRFIAYAGTPGETTEALQTGARFVPPTLPSGRPFTEAGRDPKALSSVKTMLEVAGGGALGHLLHGGLGSLIGAVGVPLVAGTAKASTRMARYVVDRLVANPATWPLAQRVLLMSPKDPDYARFATVLLGSLLRGPGPATIGPAASFPGPAPE